MFLSNIPFLDSIKEFFANNLVARMILDGWFVLIVVSVLVLLALKFKKARSLTFIGVLLFAFYFVAKFLELPASLPIYQIAITNYVIICGIILAPELRKMMEIRPKTEGTKELIASTTEMTVQAVADAVFTMAAGKVGALITFEQHYSLTQFAERAVLLNSDVSKELLEQIFIKDSPLHDGGVIIRGNKIVCAAAYYTLTQAEQDKTMGSRHRAGIGISEITDSLTIIVSEETGDVHVANQGFMKLLSDKNELINYLSTYLGKSI